MAEAAAGDPTATTKNSTVAFDPAAAYPASEPTDALLVGTVKVMRASTQSGWVDDHVPRAVSPNPSPTVVTPGRIWPRIEPPKSAMPVMARPAKVAKNRDGDRH
jgi:hypothetical protein